MLIARPRLSSSVVLPAVFRHDCHVGQRLLAFEPADFRDGTGLIAVDLVEESFFPPEYDIPAAVAGFSCQPQSRARQRIGRWRWLVGRTFARGESVSAIARAVRKAVSLTK
jgi:hypothetical protein